MQYIHHAPQPSKPRLTSSLQFSASSSGFYVQTQEMQDSGQYIDTQSNKILSNYQVNKYQARNNAFIIVGVILVIWVWNLGARKYDRKEEEGKQGERKGRLWEEYLYVQSENGTKVRLDYPVSQIIKPQKVQQYEMGILKIPTSQQFLTFAKSFPTPQQFSSKLFRSHLSSTSFSSQHTLLSQTQFFLLDTKYNLRQAIAQSKLCIISPFYNILQNTQQLQLYLKTLNQQNYSNYHVNFIDDYSNDNSTQYLLNQAKSKFKRLNNRMTIIRNKINIGALGNRDISVRERCTPGDIVIDIDGDDAIIGNQVFNTINRIYHNNPQLWLVYFNYLSLKSKGQSKIKIIDFTDTMQPGISKTIQQSTYKQNNYRTNMRQWVTSQLRTFKRDLYMSIPLQYLIERGTREYYLKASDRFTMYALVELAGQEHTRYYQEFFYFYFQPNYVVLEENQANLCILPSIFYDEAKSRILSPLLPLSKLGQKARKTQNYTIPSDIADHYVRRQKKYLQCTKKQRQKLNLLKPVQHIRTNIL